MPTDPFASSDLSDLFSPNPSNSTPTPPNSPSSPQSPSSSNSSFSPNSPNSPNSRSDSFSSAFNLPDFPSTPDSSQIFSSPSSSSNSAISQNYNNYNNPTTNSNSRFNNTQSFQPPSTSPSIFTPLLSSSSTLSLQSYLQSGSVFWKAGRMGSPHFLFFELSADSSYIQWYSRNKSLKHTKISLPAILGVSTRKNMKFMQYCNNRLLNRSISISTSSINNINSSNSKEVTEVDFISVSTVNFSIWAAFLKQIKTFNEIVRKNGMNGLNGGSSLNVDEMVRELGEMSIEINLPSEVAQHCYVMHRFELFAARASYANNNENEDNINRNINSGLRWGNKEGDSEIMKEVIRICNKIRNKCSGNKKLNKEKKNKLMSRIEVIESDLKVLDREMSKIGELRGKKIMWMMLAESIALNEMFIAMNSSEREKNSVGRLG